MQSAIQVAQSDITGFAICLSGISEQQRSIEIDFCRSFERELTLPDIPFVLGRVEVNFHALDCMYKKVGCQSIDYRRLSAAVTIPRRRTL
jgi:hypothetical protein